MQAGRLASSAGERAAVGERPLERRSATVETGSGDGCLGAGQDELLILANDLGVMLGSVA